MGRGKKFVKNRLENITIERNEKPEIRSVLKLGTKNPKNKSLIAIMCGCGAHRYCASGECAYDYGSCPVDCDCDDHRYKCSYECTSD